MTQALLHQILDGLTQALAAALLAGALALGKRIDTHFKNIAMANALKGLADLAVHAVNAAAHSISISLEAGQKPNASTIVSQALDTLQTTGSQAAGVLVANGGFTQDALKKVLQTLVQSAMSQLQIDAGGAK